MVVRVRIGSPDMIAGQWRTGHKSLSLLYSMLLHGGLVALAFLPSDLVRDDSRSVYRETIMPLEKEHKVIYYDFRKELPEVSAANASAKTTTPTPNELQSKQRIVTAPQEKNGKQFVWLPAPKVKLQEELKAPNLIALAPPITVPAPEKPQPKAFQAPELPKNVPAKVSALPSAPQIAGVTSDKQSAEISALLNKPVAGPPPKQFVVPKEGKVTLPQAADLPNAPTIAGITGGKQSAEVSALLNKPLAGPPPKPFTPPTRTGGNGSGNGGGTAPAAALPTAPSLADGGQVATASIAIIGLNPANVPQIPTPEGGRAARIVAGTPVPGATKAELGGGNGSIAVPDLSVQGGTATSPATATRASLDRSQMQPATGLARAQTPPVLPTTPHVSVPQWPSTRSLPQLVERHFQNRVVYLTVIPGAQSNDDWTVWFGELAATPLDAHPLMRPPMLMHSTALPPIPAYKDRGAGQIRVVCTIRKDGHVEAVSELAGPGLDREVTGALSAWQFSPATRNGVPVDADAVIEIPVVFGTLSSR